MNNLELQPLLCYNLNMNIFTSLEIFIISALIIVSLKAIPGIFAIFHHYASGKYSARKVSDLSIFFILGAETLPAITFVILNLILSAFAFVNLDFTSSIFLTLFAGLLFSLALVFYFCYFQKGKGTKLFITRQTAQAFDFNAQKVKNRSDAFTLGFIAGLPELIFTLPLYLMVLISISKNFIFPSVCAPILTLFVIITVTPLFALYAYFRNGNNLANFSRLRTRNKSFFRLFIPSLYILLGALLIIQEALL